MIIINEFIFIKNEKPNACSRQDQHICLLFSHETIYKNFNCMRSSKYEIRYLAVREEKGMREVKNWQ
jgi:hypothetical protein